MKLKHKTKLHKPARDLGGKVNKNLMPYQEAPYRRIAEEIKDRTKKSFSYYGFKIKMKYCETNLNDALIYRIKLPKRKKFRNFLALVSEVQRHVGLSCEVFEEDFTLYMVISLRRPDKTYLSDIINDTAFDECLDTMDLPIIIGCDLRGKIIIRDLAKLYHMLIGGASGSGKSVFLHCLITCLITCQPVQKVNLILLDFGLGGLTMFDGIPHLSRSVATNAEEAKNTIEAVESEMERRYENPEEFDEWPYLVIIADESSARVTKFEFKEDREKYTNANNNLARLGRKVKIIMIQVAQEPKKTSMKMELANFTAKAAFTCSDYHQSVAMLGKAGAEKLPGNGAMYFKSPESNAPMRLQGAYLESEDIKELVAELASKSYDLTGKFVIPEFDAPSLSEGTEIVSENCMPVSQEQLKDEQRDKELCDIILWVLGRDTVSALQIMKHFNMSNRASDIIRKITELGIVGEKVANQPRKVLCKCADDLSDEAVIFLTDNDISVHTIEEAVLKNLEPKEANV